MGFLSMYSAINKLDLLLSFTINRTYLYVYMIIELFVAGALITHSLIQINYALLILGVLLFISGLSGFWINDEIKDRIKADTSFDYIGVFTYFLLGSLVFYFDSVG
tara:strand:- start:10843 stop:11160 length:318 start_codon:yes stop_codon:yes gene_type:complete